MTTAPTSQQIAVIAYTWVPGNPAPQGSKKGYARNGKVVMVESSRQVRPWREDVRWSLLGLPHETREQWPYQGAVWLVLEFVMPRPASAPKRRTPPMTQQPDMDKLTRAVKDAITSAGVWRDDSLVTTTMAHKRRAKVDENPGCWISVLADPHEGLTEVDWAPGGLRAAAARSLYLSSTLAQLR